jgi:hypothetical protein
VGEVGDTLLQPDPASTSKRAPMTTDTAVVELTKENFTDVVGDHPFAVVDF